MALDGAIVASRSPTRQRKVSQLQFTIQDFALVTQFVP